MTTTRELSPAKQRLLAKRLRGERLGPSALEQVAASARPERLPLSFAQQRLWFLDRLEGASAQYNLLLTVPLRGPLDHEALDRAVHRIIARHETLRTRYVELDGEPVQVVESTLHVDVPIADLRGLPPDEQRRRAAAEAQHDRSQPFDLEHGPVMRVKVILFGDREQVLLRTLHHIATDAWSEALFAHELRTLYEAMRNGGEDPFAPLPIQYADYARWQRAHLTPAALEPGLAYWTRQLQDAPATLNLPTDRPRPPVQTFAGETCHATIPAGLAGAARQVCDTNQATPYMMLLAAFGVVLARHCGQDDLVVGSPVVNRPEAKLEGAIGLFVNSLAMRLRLDAGMSFRELLAQVRQTALDAYEHQHVPFEQLVERLAPPRRLDTSPVFQVMFALQNVPAPTEAPARLRLPPSNPPLALSSAGQQPARFELEVHARELNGEILLSWLYNRDLFDRGRIERMARQYRRVLDTATTTVDSELSRFDLLDPAERRTILDDWSGSAGASTSRGVDELFDLHAERSPGATAVICEGRTTTYRELGERVRRLAHHLLARGAGPERLVAVALPRSIDTVVALLAVLETGAAYLPLDPGYPRARLQIVLDDASPVCLITTSALATDLPEHRATVILDDPSTATALEACDVTSPGRGGRRPRLDPRSIAYVLYTSGSTGAPKGVMVERGALAAFLEAMDRAVPFLPSDRLVAVTTTTFDISLLELLLPLCRGACVIVATTDEVHDPGAVAALVRRHRATSLQATPSYWKLLAQQHGDAFERLRALVGGEALTLDTAGLLRSSAQAVFNLYGPTEATIWASVDEVGESSVAAGGSAASIGRPLANYRLFILDRYLAPVPPGVPGELFIGGVALARGYLGRPGLTATRFVAGPHGAPGTRMYRTGDLARWGLDGRVEFIGRVDHQVKVRGFRIELGEIEHALEEHESVEDAVVTVDRTGSDDRILAYVRCRHDEAALRAANTAHVREWQAVYDETYRKGVTGEADFNTVDWVSSYTGEPIPAVEMRAWVDDTVRRLQRFGAARVLEIGCGTGLLLSRLAPACERYVGIDASAAGIDHVRSMVARRPDLAHVELTHGFAHDLSFLAGDAVDLVILNSVVQYFPGIDYLLDVLAQAVRVTTRGGTIFVGDVRNLTLLRAFHTSVQLHRAAGDVSLGELRRRIDAAIRNEKELLIDSALFDELAHRWDRIGYVEKSPKGGGYENEVSRFRYDVTLHLDSEVAPAAPGTFVDWDEQGTWWEEIQAMRRADPRQTLGVRGIPDRRQSASLSAVRRLQGAGAAGQRVRDLRSALSAAGPGEDPSRLLALGQEPATRLFWRGFDRDGLYTLIVNPAFAPRDGRPGEPAAFYRRYGNAPAVDLRSEEPGRVLLDHLRRRLPEYMVPASIAVLAEWPLTSGGKLDRSRLPVPDRRLAPDYEPPRTAAEAALCSIVAEVMGIERVGVDDDFFALGGHSLMAMRVIGRIRSDLGATIAVREFFELRTVGALAGRLRAVAPGEGDAPATPIRRIPRDGPLPLSFNQECALFGMWLMSLRAEPNVPFQLPFVMRMSGPIDVAALEAALNELVRRHESLRTAFSGIRGVLSVRPLARALMTVAGGLMRFITAGAILKRLAATRRRGGATKAFRQTIAESAPVRLERVDVSHFEPGARVLRLRRVSADMIERPLDVGRPPLLRATLVKRAEGEHLLMVTVHHLVCDGWSLGILRRELGILYRAFANGRPSPLPDLPVQLVDVAAWERARLQGETLERMIAYWRDHLADSGIGKARLTVGDLPFALPSPAVPTQRIANRWLALPHELRERLDRLCLRENATLYMALFATFALLLHRVTGRALIGLGSNFANRTHPVTEGVVGCLAQTHELVLRFAPADRVVDVLAQARQALLGAFAHQEVPAVLLWSTLGLELRMPKRVVDVLPIVFDRQANEPDAEETDGAGIGAVPLGVADSDPKRLPVGLFLRAFVNPGGVKVGIWYPVDRLADRSIAVMCDEWRDLLATLVETPGASISALPAARLMSPPLPPRPQAVPPRTNG